MTLVVSFREASDTDCGLKLPPSPVAIVSTDLILNRLVGVVKVQIFLCGQTLIAVGL